ncbi:MAG: glycosyltransferase family 4 protein [Candidatus Methanomethylicaceae archaeon]
MKILFLLGFPNPFPGAGWARIGFFADAWSREGHSIEILGTFTYKSFQKIGSRKADNVNIFNIIFSIGINNPMIFALNCLISLLVSTLFLLTRKPAITIVSMPPGDIGVGALMACILTKTKSIVDYRDEWEVYATNLANTQLNKKIYCAIKKFTNLLYTKTSLLVAVTQPTLKTLIKRGLKNVELITNGADIRTFKPLITEKIDKTFTIFYSGGIGGYYRLDVVVKAIKELFNKGLSNIRLAIASGDEIQPLLRLSDELGVSKNIKYLGSIEEKTELAKLIAMSDVGTIPYDNNPLWKNTVPAKFYEYCACGIPVIATTYNDSLLAELIRTYQIGLTCPPLNEKKLANVIYWLYENKDFRDAAGQRSRKLVEEKFDRNKIAKEYLSVIEKMVAQK